MNGSVPAREAHRKKARPPAKRFVQRLVLSDLVTGWRAMTTRFWLPDRRGLEDPRQDRIACESAPARRPRKRRASTADDGNIEQGCAGARTVRLCRANPKDAAGLEHTGQAGQARREEDGKSRDFQTNPGRAESSVARSRPATAKFGSRVKSWIGNRDGYEPPS